jgi:hypothetical protein
MYEADDEQPACSAIEKIELLSWGDNKCPEQKFPLYADLREAWDTITACEKNTATDEPPSLRPAVRFAISSMLWQHAWAASTRSRSKRKQKQNPFPTSSPLVQLPAPPTAVWPRHAGAGADSQALRLLLPRCSHPLSSASK